MVLVDSSVWISLLRGMETAAVQKLRDATRQDRALLADIVLLELLQGAKNEAEADRLERYFAAFPSADVLDRHVAIRSAANYRLLRSKGFTIRKTIDVIIGTFCILNDHALLHEDRDFEPMVEHLGLKVV